MSAPESPAEVLRRAAGRLGRHADEVEQEMADTKGGYWGGPGSRNYRDGIDNAIGGTGRSLAALFTPAAARSLAGWLWLAAEARLEFGGTPDLPLALARELLEEDGPASPDGDTPQEEPPALPHVSIPQDGSPVRYGDFMVKLLDGVVVSLPGVEPCGIPPRAALELAAYITAYARLAESEPDPDDVSALAQVIAGDCSAGIESALPQARKILLAGYRKAVS